jgi:hypothetical protein
MLENIPLFITKHPTRLSKTSFAERFSWPGASRETRSGVAGGVLGVLPRQGSVDRPKGVDLADIVHQSEPRTRPLYIDF